MFRIKAWADTFEVRLDGKRPKKRLPWFSYPNEPGSTGLAMLLGGWSSSGRTGLALWPLLLSIVADLPAELRSGELLRADGTPHTVATIAARYRLPVADVEEGVSALMATGWLTQIADSTNTSQDFQKSPEKSVLARAPGRDVTGRDGTERNEEQGHAPGGAPPATGTTAASTAPRPKAPRTKLLEKPWPEGWTFGDAEWAIAERAGAPSREAAALAFEALREWALEHDATSKRWELRWSTWCRNCRDRYGWPKPASGGAVRGAAPAETPPPALTPEEEALEDLVVRAERTPGGMEAWRQVLVGVQERLQHHGAQVFRKSCHYLGTLDGKHYIHVDREVSSELEERRAELSMGPEFVLVPRRG